MGTPSAAIKGHRIASEVSSASTELAIDVQMPALTNECPICKGTLHMSKPYEHSSRCWLTFSALLLLGFLQTASAMSIRELRALERSNAKQGADFVVYYLVGAMEATVHADAAAARSGDSPRICLNGRRLDPSMALSLYNTELRRNAELYEADMPVPLVMLNALERVYTC
jgi:hypothetical protein